MKFSQLTEYNMRNAFIGKSSTKCGGETSPRSFSEKSPLSRSLDIVYSLIQFVFIVCQVENY